MSDDDDDLFADMDDPDEGWELPPDADDRTILHAIWLRDEIGDLSAYDAWSLLQERYPEDSRILLAMLYEETHPNQDRRPDGELVDMITRLVTLAGKKLAREIRNLVACADFDLASNRGDLDRRIAALRARVGEPPEEDPFEEGGPHARMARFVRSLVRELHDVTMNHRPIAAPPAKKPATWKERMASVAKVPAKPYAADAVLVVNDRIEHPKFGTGVVANVSEGRATILFESGERRLACRQG